MTSKAVLAAAVCLACAGFVAMAHGQTYHAAEWRRGQFIDLGGLPGYSVSSANGINNGGQVVGESCFNGAGGGICLATEWSRGQIIDLGSLAPPFVETTASGISDNGQVVGVITTPEPATWDMMLVGFGVLGVAFVRRRAALDGGRI